MLEVINSPFNEKQVKQLNEVLATLTPQQKIWLTGYLTASANIGVIEAPREMTQQAVASSPIQKHVTILYASQTGNAQKLAEKFGDQLQQIGLEVSVSSMSDYKTNALKKAQYLLIVASTHGEGEPPDNAIAFHSFLHGKRAPKLDHVQYAVLALGDSSYEYFCQTGKDFDIQLEKLGAKRLVDRVDCDVDYAEQAEKWFGEVKEKLHSEFTQFTPSEQEAAATVLQEETEYSRKNPFVAEIIEKINLNGQGSNKETIHLELSLENSGIAFEPGDCLAIIPINNQTLVNSLISALGFEASTKVDVDGTSVTLEEALLKTFEITLLTKPLMNKIAEYTENKDFHALIENQETLKQFMNGRDLLDVVEQFGPFNWDAQGFINCLRKIPARQYSISSSLLAYPEEAHVTIGVVRYEVDGRERLGVCSTYVADQLEVGDQVQVYVQKNPNFKLVDDDTPIIMIGPGTGVAPFRAFVQEREERGASGENWLFFGDQHFVTDFLYQREWLNWLKSGVLTKLDVAFSRDQEEKVYVQHKMLKHAKELYAWLEKGAAVYVCGDKNMAKDVQETLLRIIQQEGNKSEEDAMEYLEELRKQKRYQRDVY
ncbi:MULTISPECIES: assimilatory sulfite reductase (NADPH) flavoprotein subunit [Ureibacillus]|uniref:assimilatory sulfite reductase (NADPH) n=1 Tax=Ureibacillus thermosphaericus TaxID=51173 RepID=A0A840PQM1_URETH|nr:assimilatory sulfite reductase (NADPH) flavoprotein subunit [Ureibacillus thermosphaericus]MBB5148127.1 sulfite reductase (NADPH) flavoprotein alpha-component [Ureibacillus thermosphaericus]NKZ30838.1 assimilatory sulfite reductase (NADPH) flavoprotein subunit [Ureibacillus thermosphaericus]